ncbi:carbohydrate kinase family protein [Patescibacteria group bacterium]|nr:carbohydrate kinase family protein [Patescibacteria group bacterium]
MTAKKTFDILCIGESLRDIFYMINEATVSCSIHKDQCLLCLEYAEKIPVKDVVKIPAAGNAANAAVSAARLNLKSALISWAGDDPAGNDLKKHLKSEKVDVSALCTCSKQQTSEATLLSFKGERTQLLFFKPRKYFLPKTIPQSRCIYYSAMGDNFNKLDNQLKIHLKKNSKTIFSFQPGTTHLRKGLKYLKPLIALSNIFILNKEEANSLLDGEQKPTLYILEKFHKLGAKNVVITDGKNGAHAFDGNDHWHMPIFPGEAHERTGAGDAMASGFTCAILENKTVPEALRWGTANSWSVIQKIGPQKSLPNKLLLNKILTKFKSIQPIKI